MNAHAPRRHRLRSLGALALVAVIGLGAAGCSGDGDNTATDPAAGDTSSEPTASPTESATSEPTEEAPKEPQCTDVWVAGAKLKGGYDGCYDGDKRIKPDGRYCEFGKPLIVHDMRFWAVPGGVVHEVEGKLLDDAKYRDALMKCGG